MRSVIERISNKLDENNKSILFSDVPYHPFEEELNTLCSLYTRFDPNVLNFYHSIQMSELSKLPMDAFLTANLSFESELLRLKNQVLFKVIFNGIFPSKHTIAFKIIDKPMKKEEYLREEVNEYLFYSKANKRLHGFEDDPKGVVLPYFLDINKYNRNKTGNKLALILYNVVERELGNYDDNIVSGLQYTKETTMLDYINVKAEKLTEILQGSQCTVNTSFSSCDVYPYLVSVACGCPVLSVPNLHMFEYFGKENVPTFENVKEFHSLQREDLKKIWKGQFEALQQYDISKGSLVWAEAIKRWSQFC